MGRKTICYRGSLKSCNYRCSYCPFSKHRASVQELEKDRQNFGRFCESIADRAAEFDIGAVFVVPYGEASIHRWYWEGLGRLAGLDGLDRVGLQTNLSFSVEECLAIFDLYSGDANRENIRESDKETCKETAEKTVRGISGAARRKLCIWATFHPEMTDMETFVEKCHRLADSGVNLCVGAVGAPQNIPLLGRLRERLSPDLYLWINKMDGLGRVYTAEEKRAFLELDPFFGLECGSPAADVAMCSDRCFVEADGRIRACNIGRIKEGNWYQSEQEEIFRPLCGKKRCSCYLAYGGRADFEGRQFFGAYPIFRVPKPYQAVFLDLDGTLVPEKHRGRLADSVRRKLLALREKRPVFLATSMPAEEVRRRLGEDLELFQGAVFASGAYVWMRTKEESGKADGSGEKRKGAAGREVIHPVDLKELPRLTELAAQCRAGVRVYRKRGREADAERDTAYKITLVKRHNSVWQEQERQRAAEILQTGTYRIFVEKNCLEIIAAHVDKGTGVREICGWLGIRPEEAIAVGNDREDRAMRPVLTRPYPAMPAAPPS
ncbi:MAG: HAD hydrolase family protein [Lachnospiraceae bacterium]|nr:HAD hydrolase family protein [Lachnospiraceae bacterium]